MGKDPYAAIADIYDLWCADVVEDVPFYRAACRGAEGPIVEIGAGTGRIAIPLALDGHAVVALDRSAPMLARLAERATTAGVRARITLVEGDLRALPPLPRTDRVLAPFRVLLHLGDDEARAAFLGAVRAVLVPGGHLVFDVFEPTRADVRDTHGRELERDSGVRELTHWDEQARQLELQVRYRGRATTMELAWTPGERWRSLLGEAGFSVIAATTGFEGQPFRGQRGDSAWIARREEDDR